MMKKPCINVLVMSVKKTLVCEIYETNVYKPQTNRFF